MHWLLIIPEKSDFAPILAQKQQTKIILPKNHLRQFQVLSLFNFMKKSEKFPGLTFGIAKKISFWPLLDQKLQNKVISKTTFALYLSHYAAATSC